MAITKLNIEEFLTLLQVHPVLDVRSPGEFGHAHIPGAYNLPLFSESDQTRPGFFWNEDGEDGGGGGEYSEK